MEYNCEKCKYKTVVKQNYNKHLQTDKHKIIIESNEEFKNICPKCDKIILSRTSLWRHTKNCKATVSVPHANVVIVNNNTTNELLQKMLEKQIYLEKLVIELSQNQANVVITNSNNNSNNFNLNFFLNEQCKDAINIKDFVKELNVELQTLHNIENNGYVKGVSDFIVDNLQKYSVYTRPIHFVNNNEEKTVQIRDENEWKQDTNWESNTNIYSDPETEQESLFENTIADIDEKIYDEFKEYQTQSLHEQPKLKKELLNGVKLQKRYELMNTVLDKVSISQ